MTAIGVFVATRWELDAVRRAFPTIERRSVGGVGCAVARGAQAEWWIIPMGVGPERAATTARKVLSGERFTSVWSTGFACALGPARIGEVLIGTQVVVPTASGADAPVGCDPAVVEWTRQAMEQQLLPAQVGRFVSVPRVLWRAADKQDVAGRTGGIGLDMESAALSLAAAERKIPFAIVRTVSDLVDEDLPLDFNLFLRPSGWIKGVAACLGHPTSLIGLNRLRGQSRVAGMRLTALYRVLAERALPEGQS